jgi:hypothetical protein
MNSADANRDFGIVFCALFDTSTKTQKDQALDALKRIAKRVKAQESAVLPVAAVDELPRATCHGCGNEIVNCFSSCACDSTYGGDDK